MGLGLILFGNLMKSSHLFRSWSAVLVFGTAVACGSVPAKAQSNPGLEHLLDLMDKDRESFRSAEASLVWDVYTSVVQDTDTQKGRVSYRRQGNETQMALEFTDPSPKYVIFAGGKLQLFESRLNRVTVYDSRKNQGEVESFLVLGFGGGGHALAKSYELKYLGMEKVEGVDAAQTRSNPQESKSPKYVFAHHLVD